MVEILRLDLVNILKLMFSRDVDVWLRLHEMLWKIVVAIVLKSVKPILQVVGVWPALAGALVAQFPSLEKSLAQWLNGLVNSRPELVNISKHSNKKTLSTTSAKRFFFLWLPSGCSEEENSYLARQCYNIPPNLPKQITLPI